MKTMKQATFGGKRVLRLFSGVLLAALLLCATCVTAFAAADSASLDFSQEGSVTVTLYSDENEAAVTDGTLTLYEVASLYLDDGNMAYAKTGDFAVFEGALDVYDAALGDALAEYVTENGLTGISVQPDANGSVTFSGLELGLYLVVQTEESEGYYAIDPFLVTVPVAEGDAWVYNVNATPKTAIYVNPGVAGGEPSDTEPVNPTESTMADKAGSLGNILPQTGQLNWPIPVLAAAGALLVVIGLVVSRKKKAYATAA